MVVHVGQLSTNEVGLFRLNVNADKGPVELVISYIGYESQTVQLKPTDNELTINLIPSLVMLNATVVAASRVEESIARAPVTIDKVSDSELTILSP